MLFTGMFIQVGRVTVTIGTEMANLIMWNDSTLHMVLLVIQNTRENLYLIQRSLSMLRIFSSS